MDKASQSSEESSAAGELEFEARAAVELSMRGDSARVGQLLESYRPRLERMVTYRLDPRLRGRVEADDVIQDAFSEIYTRLSEMDLSGEEASRPSGDHEENPRAHHSLRDG